MVDQTCCAVYLKMMFNSECAWRMKIKDCSLLVKEDAMLAPEISKLRFIGCLHKKGKWL